MPETAPRDSAQPGVCPCGPGCSRNPPPRRELTLSACLLGTPVSPKGGVPARCAVGCRVPGTQQPETETGCVTSGWTASGRAYRGRRVSGQHLGSICSAPGVPVGSLQEVSLKLGFPAGATVEGFRGRDLSRRGGASPGPPPPPPDEVGCWGAGAQRHGPRRARLCVPPRCLRTSVGPVHPPVGARRFISPPAH